jgi:2-oxoglutarate ferredoxin oxidoreductase subunit beta
MMHDGVPMRFRKTSGGYDPTDREAAYAHVRACQKRGEVATGLLFIDESGHDMHAVNHTIERPLVDVPYEELCPGSAALEELMGEFR